MKKIFLAALIGLLPTLLIAQSVAFNNKTLLPDGINEPTSDPATSAKTRKAAHENKQFDKTTKMFNQDFANASDVHWVTGKSEFIGSFTKDGVHNTVWYSKSGALLYTMRTYNADKLPTTERRIIEDEYGGYNITLVDEVHQNNITVYVVHIENDRNIKLVTVCDGETNIYREYKKM
jgi:hypothetical protein